jgi:hypothetical protein
MTLGNPNPNPKKDSENPFGVKNMAMMGLLGQMSSEPHKSSKDLQKKTQMALDSQKVSLELFEKDMIISKNSRKLNLYKNVH